MNIYCTIQWHDHDQTAVSAGETGALQTGHRGSWSTACVMQRRWYECPQGSATASSPCSTSSWHTVHIGIEGCGCGGTLRRRHHHVITPRLASQMSRSTATSALTMMSMNFHRQSGPNARTMGLQASSGSSTSSGLASTAPPIRSPAVDALSCRARKRKRARFMKDHHVRTTGGL